MAVAVFIYHRTPAGPAEDHYDVPLATFRSQIDRLIEANVPFIRFRDVHKSDYLAEGMHVALTFDDGHASNRAAFEYLSGKGIVPTAFIVRDWAQSRPDYLSAADIAGLAHICDFGGHGATHTALPRLTDTELRQELTASRDFLQETTGRPVEIMALPGGAGDDRVVAMARACGYRLVGNSVSNINRRAGASINRLTIIASDSADRPLELASAGDFFWLRRSARIAAVNGARRVLGDGNYAKASAAIKRLVS